MKSLTFIPISSENKHYQFVQQLINTSFPSCERRDDELQRTYVDTRPQMQCRLIMQANKPVGVITSWLLSGYCYVEHFAIHPDMRSVGIGSEAFRLFRQEIQMPIVLEVEPPNDGLTRRRIDFYRRAGLQLWADKPYMQPPYRASDSETPLLLMATDGLDQDKDFNRVSREIHTTVYGKKYL